jgi:putative FmdB family regulatory protein
MPAYDFECKKCGHQFTVAESFKEHERHREKCPQCASRKVAQLMSPVYARTSRKS